MNKKGLNSTISVILIVLISVVAVVIISLSIKTILDKSSESTYVESCRQIYGDGTDAFENCVIDSIGSDNAKKYGIGVEEFSPSSGGIPSGVTARLIDYNDVNQSLCYAKIGLEMTEGQIQGNCASPVKNGLVAHYCFDGDSNDNTANANDGIEYGDLNYQIENSGNAYAKFDGIDDYVKVDSSASLDLNDYTYSFWMKSGKSTSTHIAIQESLILFKPLNMFGEDAGDKKGYPYFDALGYPLEIGSTARIDYSKSLPGGYYYIYDLEKPNGQAYSAIGNAPARLSEIVTEGYIKANSVQVIGGNDSYYRTSELLIARTNGSARNQEILARILEGNRVESFAEDYTKKIVGNYLYMNDSWHLVTLTKQLVGGKTVLKYYVDGNMVSQSNSSYMNGGYPNRGRNFDMYIGKMQPLVSNDHLFSGALDNLMIYNRSLSQGEVSTLFYAGRLYNETGQTFDISLNSVEKLYGDYSGYLDRVLSPPPYRSEFWFETLAGESVTGQYELNFNSGNTISYIRNFPTVSNLRFYRNANVIDNQIMLNMTCLRLCGLEGENVSGTGLGCCDEPGLFENDGGVCEFW